MNFSSKRSRLLWTLIAITLAIVVASYARRVIELTPAFSDPYYFTWLFTIGRTASISAWFTSMLLLAVAAALTLITIVKRREGQPFTWHWAGLALLFTLLSINESTAFYNRILNNIEALMGESYRFYLWAIAAVVLLIAAALMYYRFAAHLFREVSPRLRGWLIVSTALYFGGFLVGHFISDAYYEANTGASLTYELIRDVEEGLEMFGAALLLIGLTDYLAALAPQAQFHAGGGLLLEYQPLPTPTFSISPRKAALLITAVVGVMILINVLIKFNDPTVDIWSGSRLTLALDMNFEASVPTWLSSTLLLLSGLVAWIIASARRRASSNYVGHWRGLAAIFMLLSLDEMTSIHEKTMDPLRNSFGTGGIFYYAWIIPALALVALFALVYVRFWWRLQGRTRMLLAIAAVLFVGGAVGMEMVSGKYAEQNGDQTLTYALFAIIEETLELAGIGVFVYALLGYLAITRRETKPQASESLASRTSTLEPSYLKGADL